MQWTLKQEARVAKRATLQFWQGKEWIGRQRPTAGGKGPAPSFKERKKFDTKYFSHFITYIATSKKGFKIL